MEPNDNGLPPRDPQPPVEPTPEPAAPVVPTTPPPVEPAPSTILVDAAKLKSLMDRLDAQAAEMAEQKAQMARLEAAASKAGLANYDNKHRAKPGKSVKVRSYEGKLIVGWRKIIDMVEKNPDTKVWTERQIIELIFEDDTTVQIPYSIWVNRYSLQPAEVKATTTLDDDTIVYTLKLEDGREIKLGQAFVN